MKLFGTMEIKGSELFIGNVSVAQLQKDFGTPLYIMDEEFIRQRCRMFFQNFKSDSLDTEVIYASKAFLNISMAELVNQEKLSIDVVSGGELYTVLQAKFPREKIYFHGNNKLQKEIEYAVENDVGVFVIDNEREVDLLEEVLKQRGKIQRVLLRINLGIEAHTHEYIQTAKNDSKFGISIFDQKIFDMIKRVAEIPQFKFDGFHCHIGSQIFEEQSFLEEASEMMKFVKTVKDKLNVDTSCINLGGGFGVYYTGEDKPMDMKALFKTVLKQINDECKEYSLVKPKVLIEPGRAIVCNAGSTLYEIGSVKKTFGGKEYIFIDGGMTDNIRPSLYQAKYEACVATKMDHESNGKFSVAGKCCESGDILIENISLPGPEPGDLLLIGSTGAYTYSMASNYNRIEKPAVVFVKDGAAKLVVKRETYEDLIRNDIGGVL